MAFVKAQWRLIVFGLVVLLSLGAAAWGMMSQSEITEKMEVVRQIRQNVMGLASGAVNKQSIEDKKKENEELQKRLAATEQTAFSVQFNSPFHEKADTDGNASAEPRIPLLEGVLPELTSRGHASSFQTEYGKEFEKILQRLHAGDKPTSDEIRREEDNIKRTGSGPQKPKGSDEMFQIPLQAPGDSVSQLKSMTKLDVLRANASSVVAYRNAKQIWMYVSEGAIGQHPLVKSTTPPSVEEIWHAQMSLWIQQDLLAALARCNEQRAAQLRKAGETEKLWVAYMPVKHLETLSIDRKLGNGGGGSNFPKDGFANSFTGKQNNADMFVVPSQLTLVVEQPALPGILDTLTRTGFYTPTLVNFTKVTPNPKQEGYVYGSDPVVRVVIDLEGYYFRKVYDKWIPKTLAQVMGQPNAGADTGPMSGAGAGGGFRGGRP